MIHFLNIRVISRIATKNSLAPNLSFDTLVLFWMSYIYLPLTNNGKSHPSEVDPTVSYYYYYLIL